MRDLAERFAQVAPIGAVAVRQRLRQGAESGVIGLAVDRSRGFGPDFRASAEFLSEQGVIEG